MKQLCVMIRNIVYLTGVHPFAKKMVLKAGWITPTENKKEGISREGNSMRKGVETVKFRSFLANTE